MKKMRALQNPIFSYSLGIRKPFVWLLMRKLDINLNCKSCLRVYQFDFTAN